MPGSSYFYGDYAFAHEEAGFHETAERFGKMAVELDPSSLGSHAVAHVLEMQTGPMRGLIGFPVSQAGGTRKTRSFIMPGGIAALFHLERGESDEVFELFSQEVQS